MRSSSRWSPNDMRVSANKSSGSMELSLLRAIRYALLPRDRELGFAALPTKRCLELSGAQKLQHLLGWRVPDTFLRASRFLLMLSGENVVYNTWRPLRCPPG